MLILSPSIVLTEQISIISLLDASWDYVGAGQLIWLVSGITTWVSTRHHHHVHRNCWHVYNLEVQQSRIVTLYLLERATASAWHTRVPSCNNEGLDPWHCHSEVFNARGDLTYGQIVNVDEVFNDSMERFALRENCFIWGLRFFWLSPHEPALKWRETEREKSKLSSLLTILC